MTDAVSKAPADILMCIDSKFILPAGAFILSLCENNPDRAFRFHVFVTKEDAALVRAQLGDRLAKLVPEAKIFVLSYEDTPLYRKLCGSINKRRLISCGRILAAGSCQIESRNLLYLDADMICTGSIDELLDTDLGNAPIGVIPDKPGTGEITNVYGTNVTEYFCAGVLVINQKEWLRGPYAEDCVNFILKYNPRYTDQDALNVICPVRHVFGSRYQRVWRLEEDTAILHYVGDKPWLPWCFKRELESLNLFRRYAKTFEPNVCRWISFRQERLPYIDLSGSRFGTKWLSRKLLKRGAYKGALTFFIRHWQIKIGQKGFMGILLGKSSTQS